MANKRILDTPEKNMREPPKKSVCTDESQMEDRPAGPGGNDNGPPLWFSSFLTQFNKLEGRIDVFMEKLEDLNSRVNVAEETLSAVRIQLDEVTSEVNTLKKDEKELERKMDDIENRMRRNNLVLHGFQEAEKENCMALVKDFFTNFVGVPAGDYSIERCHRTPTTRQRQADKKSTASTSNNSSSARIIHVALASYQQKEHLRKQAITKLKNEGGYKGAKVYVSEDFSPRVVNLRKEKLEQLKNLKREGKKAFFMFPAKLAYRDSAGKLHFVES